MNFFYFAGSIVGGIVFLGSTIICLITCLYILCPDILTFKELALLPSIRTTIFFLSLSYVIGIAMSQLSVKLFFESAKRSDKFIFLKTNLFKDLGVKIPDLKDRDIKNPVYNFQTFMSFSNNFGHPNSLYDIAGRARLAGSGALNSIWIILLSIIVLTITFTTNHFVDHYQNQMILVVRIIAIMATVLFSLLLWGLKSLAMISWYGYLTRREFFSFYKFHDGSLTFDDTYYNMLVKTDT